MFSCTWSRAALIAIKPESGRSSEIGSVCNRRFLRKSFQRIAQFFCTSFAAISHHNKPSIVSYACFLTAFDLFSSVHMTRSYSRLQFLLLAWHLFNKMYKTRIHRISYTHPDVKSSLIRWPLDGSSLTVARHPTSAAVTEFSGCTLWQSAGGLERWPSHQGVISSFEVVGNCTTFAENPM